MTELSLDDQGFGDQFDVSGTNSTFQRSIIITENITKGGVLSFLKIAEQNRQDNPLPAPTTLSQTSTTRPSTGEYN
tara:strand:+ start:2235 stop:2462 length:228 start_codon:yes stop_codon:yes gene_type:complete